MNDEDCTSGFAPFVAQDDGILNHGAAADSELPTEHDWLNSRKEMDFFAKAHSEEVVTVQEQQKAVLVLMRNNECLFRDECTSNDIDEIMAWLSKVQDRFRAHAAGRECIDSTSSSIANATPLPKPEDLVVNSQTVAEFVPGDLEPGNPRVRLPDTLSASASRSFSPGNLISVEASASASSMVLPLHTSHNNGALNTTVAIGHTSEHLTIPVNSRGHRIDLAMETPDAEVLARYKAQVGWKALCTHHHITKNCINGDACKYDHDYVPEDIVYALRYKTRLNPCVRRGACRDEKCSHGHVCPDPDQSHAKLKSCRYRFPAEAHGVDTKIARFEAHQPVYTIHRSKSPYNSRIADSTSDNNRTGMYMENIGSHSTYTSPVARLSHVGAEQTSRQPEPISESRVGWVDHDDMRRAWKGKGHAMKSDTEAAAALRGEESHGEGKDPRNSVYKMQTQSMEKMEESLIDLSIDEGNAERLSGGPSTSQDRADEQAQATESLRHPSLSPDFLGLERQYPYFDRKEGE